MSLHIEGVPVLNVSFQPFPNTLLSSTFCDAHAAIRGNVLLFTTALPGYSSCSSVVKCTIAPALATDVILGLDWVAYLHFAPPTLPSVSSTDQSPPQTFSFGAPSHGHHGSGTLHSEIMNSETLNSENPDIHSLPVSKRTTRKNKRFIPQSPKKDTPTQFFNYVPANSSRESPASAAQPGPSKESVVVHTSVERRGVDAIEQLLLSPNVAANIFSMNSASLSKLLTMHHIEQPSGISATDARQAILTHFCLDLVSALVTPQIPNDIVFPSSQTMTFSVLSLLLSASDDRLPDDRVKMVAACLGLSYSSRVHFHLALGRRRQKLVIDHNSAQPVRDIFERVRNLPQGALLVLAQSHGIRFRKAPTVDQLRTATLRHVGLGTCGIREGYSSYLACSSIESQLEPLVTEPGTAEDPSTLLQINIIRQIAPILRTRPLRRLLELHDVSYKDSDNAKKLRSHLKKFLQRLIRGKCGEDTLTLTGSGRKERARQHARLRKEWPQVIPQHLKEKFLANFSARTNSSTFTLRTKWTSMIKMRKISRNLKKSRNGLILAAQSRRCQWLILPTAVF
ncbi:hypothetical protein B0H13DRAFT_1882394 [Mycena leptocephala]|nr:hypothetical protein B0H13DRAFT_1882394 [Mycena leptocephala]